MKIAKVVKIVRPYTPAMINFVERWLCKKAADGWRLEKVYGWKFVFRKCRPYVTRYFSYSGFGTSSGISNEYWASKLNYACKKSVLNKMNTIIYEVDFRKINTDFNYLVFLRNKFYLKHYFALLLFAIVYVALAIKLLLVNYLFACFLMFGSILLVYSLFSVVILICEVRQRTVRNH